MQSYKEDGKRKDRWHNLIRTYTSAILTGAFSIEKWKNGAMEDNQIP